MTGIATYFGLVALWSICSHLYQSQSQILVVTVAKSCGNTVQFSVGGGPGNTGGFGPGPTGGFGPGPTGGFGPGPTGGFGAGPTGGFGPGPTGGFGPGPTGGMTTSGRGGSWFMCDGFVRGELICAVMESFVNSPGTNLYIIVLKQQQLKTPSSVRLFH